MKYDNMRLREKEVTPTHEVIEKAIGSSSFSVYETFLDGLADFDIELLWQYYACSCKSWMARGQYVWVSPRGAKKEKNIFWLSAWDGYFTVAVWFLGKNREKVLDLKISKETKQKVMNAKIFGKMNTFPVEFSITDVKQLADVYELIKCKKALEA